MSISKSIDVYGGLGSWRPCVDSSVEMAQEYANGRQVRVVNELKKLDPTLTDCVIVPGGHAPTVIVNNLAAEVDEYVQKGGKLLGICTGAIAATDELLTKPMRIPPNNSEANSLYERGTLYNQRHDMKKQFGWACYPGLCVAPHIVNNTNPSHPDNFCAVDIVAPWGVSKSCLYSGPAFIHTKPGTQVLATFSDPVYLRKVEFDSSQRFLTGDIQCRVTEEVVEKKDPAAVLFYPHGKGKIVLSSVHIEVNPATFSEHAKKR